MQRWLWLSLVVIVLDQITKQWVEAQLLVFERVPLLSWLNLTLAYNEGAAFSFLADQGGWQRWFFAVLAVVVVGVLYTWLRRLSRQDLLIAVSLSLVIGGAIGNVIDRLAYGAVFDFIQFHIGSWSWYVFNVADAAIVAGVVGLLYDSFVLEGRRAKK